MASGLLVEIDMTTNTRPTRIRGIDHDTRLRARAARLLQEQFARLGVGPVTGLATFFDDNGPKGGRAMRCALTVRIPYRPSIRVERSAETPRLAFDAAYAVLERRLERYRERDRQSRRHPKKYFAASRLLGGEAPGAGRRAG
jgi:sigma 54 modulation/S30EA-like ribosomal protein